MTHARRRGLLGLLQSSGDVWAALIDVDQARFRRHARPIFGYQASCREIAGVAVGELSVTAIRSVVRRYSSTCFEVARRKRAGKVAHYPSRSAGADVEHPVRHVDPSVAGLVVLLSGPSGRRASGPGAEVAGCGYG